MLAWVKRDVASPYGAVSTLHWAVPSTPETLNDTHDVHGSPVEEVSMSTETQVYLESAEDQLGAVLWNSNSAALQHLHTHVFPHHPLLKERLLPMKKTVEAKEEGSQPPLRDVKVIELGAGVGCLGIALAMAGARSAITDLKELMPLMAYNVTLNAKRVERASSGCGLCDAYAWKWGPSATTNPKKQLRKHAQDIAQGRGGGSQGAPVSEASVEAAEVAVARSMVTELAGPSEPWLACSDFLLGKTAPTHSSAPREVAAVDYIILCDALYGNPQAWPQLLYTLTEIMVGSPEGCEVVNFCEQRVEDVEGAFLAMLDAENEHTLALWRQTQNAPEATRAAKAQQPSKRPRDSASASRSDVSGDLTLTKDDAHDLLTSPTSLLRRCMFEKQRPLCRDQMPFVWQYKREKVVDSVSDLKMPILVTRIRWVRAEADPVMPKTKKSKAE